MKKLLQLVTAVVIIVTISLSPILSFAQADIDLPLDALEKAETITNQNIESTDSLEGENPQSEEESGTGSDADTEPDNTTPNPETPEPDAALPAPAEEQADGETALVKTTILQFLPLDEELVKEEHRLYYEFTTDDNGDAVIYLRVAPEMVLAEYLFPEKLYAKTETQEEASVNIAKWNCDEYVEGMEGIFIFTPELPEEYVVDKAAELPEITVVVQPPESARMTAMAAGSGPSSVLAKIGGGALSMLASSTEKALQRKYDETGSETASFFLDLLRDNTAEDVAEILSIVKGLEQDVSRLETEVLAGFNEVKQDMLYTELSGYINEMDTISNYIDLSWLLYEQAIVNIGVNGGNVQDLNDPAFDAFFKAVDQIPFTYCFARLDALFTQTAAAESGLYPAVAGLSELQYPFEHQNTDMLIATYQMATSLQTQLLTLYGEQSARNDDYSLYNGQTELIARSFDAQYTWLDFGNKSHFAIYDDEQNLLHADNVNIQFKTQGGTYDAYEVVSNHNGQSFVVLKDPMTLNPMVAELPGIAPGTPNYDYSDFFRQNVRSLDGKYSIAGNAAALDGIFGGALGAVPYDQWLMTRGGLALSEQPQVVMVHKNGNLGKNDSAQYLMDVTSAKLPTAYATNDDYVRWAMKDIYKKKGSVTIGGVTTNKGQAKSVMIYVEQASHATTITPATQNEFLNTAILTDGQTFDMSKFPGSEMMLPNHTIIINGSVTVIGDPAKTVKGLRFLLLPSDKQPVLKLENVNLVGPGISAITDRDDMNLYLSTFGVVETWTDGAVEIAGMCNISTGTQDYRLYGIGSVDTALALTGAGTLNVTGLPAVYVPYNSTLTVQQLTLNAKAVNSNVDPKYVVYGKNYNPAKGGTAIGGAVYAAAQTTQNCGFIYINNGAAVYAKSEPAKAEYRADDIGAGFTDATGFGNGEVRGGHIENCTLNLDSGRLAEAITIGGGVTWTGKLRYKGVLKTMDFSNAGTDNTIYLNLYGDKGNVQGINLHDAIRVYDGNAFSKGDTEEFDIYAIDVGNLQYIELYSSGSDDWYGQYMTLTSKKDNYSEKTQFTIYEKLNKSMGTRKYFPNAPVHKVTITTASDDNSGSDSVIKMHMKYGGAQTATPEIDCGNYIEGNAYQKNTTDVMYVNYSALQQAYLDIGDVKSIGFKIMGNDKWHLKSVKVESIVGDSVTGTYPGGNDSLIVDQWLNEKDYYNEFYFEQQESRQYRMEVVTSSKSNAGTDDYVRYAIGDSDSNMTSFVWSSHNLSYSNSTKKGSTDTFQAAFDKPIEAINVLKIKTNGNDDWLPEKISIHRYHDGEGFGQTYVFEINEKINEKGGIKTYYSKQVAQLRGYVNTENPAGEVESAMPVYITANSLLKLKQQGEDLTIRRVNEYGEMVYEWTIHHEDLDENRLRSISRLDTTMERIDLRDAGLKGVAEAAGIVNIMDYRGTWPGAIDVSINVGELEPAALLRLYELREAYAERVEANDSPVLGWQADSNPLVDNLQVSEDGIISFQLKEPGNLLLAVEELKNG